MTRTRVETLEMLAQAQWRRRQEMEERIKRLGEYLQDEGGIGGYNVFRGLLEQMRLHGQGTYRPLGQVMLDLGLVSAGQVDEALERQSQDLVHFYSLRPSWRH
jgi:hypothetical protein